MSERQTPLTDRAIRVVPDWDQMIAHARRMERDRAVLAEALEALEEASSILVGNATTIPDPTMDGATDCWRGPLWDLENLHNPIFKARAALKSEGLAERQQEQT